MTSQSPAPETITLAGMASAYDSGGTTDNIIVIIAVKSLLSLAADLRGSALAQKSLGTVMTFPGAEVRIHGLLVGHDIGHWEGRRKSGTHDVS